MAHTPGPWRVEAGDSKSRSGYYVVDVRDTPIWSDGVDDGGVASLDDARLIAAAPDMLAALRIAEASIHSENCTRTHCCDDCVTVSAALALAEGRPLTEPQAK